MAPFIVTVAGLLLPVYDPAVEAACIASASPAIE
jgi:hypothetical protein